MTFSELLWLVLSSVGLEASLSVRDEALLLVEVSVALLVEASASEWEDRAVENRALEGRLAECTMWRQAAQALAGVELEQAEDSTDSTGTP